MTVAKRLLRGAILTLALLGATTFLATEAKAQTRGSANSSLSLLDRGDAASAASAGSQRTHISPSATLAVGMGTPGVTPAAIGVLVSLPGSPALLGYHHVPGVDFPTSYHPFFVTGAFAYAANTFVVPLAATLGAGVAPATFMIGPTMWAGFATAPITVPAGSPGVFGGPGIFPHSPPTLSVPTGLGPACGIGEPTGLLDLGGVTVGAGTKPLNIFAGPPNPDFLLPFAAPMADYVVGCYISGATVPVELQRFEID